MRVQFMMTGSDAGKSVRQDREMNESIQLLSFFIYSSETQGKEWSYVYLWCLFPFQLTLIGNTFIDMTRSMFSGDSELS